MTTYRNNPNAVLPVHISKTDEEVTLYGNINTMLNKLTGTTCTYRFSPLTGGITNQLYRATPSDINVEEVVVRFFGDGTEVFIDRVVENNVFAMLSQAGLAPAFVGLFENGRVEGMLACRNLSCEDMIDPTLIPHIAKSVAILHKQNVDMDRTVDIWSKLALFFDMAVDAFDSGKFAEGKGTDIKKMREESHWLKATMQTLHDQATASSDGDSLGTVFEYQKGCMFAFEKVMAHNDLLSGNILINNEYTGAAPPSLTIIDYEYTCYNARAFDIGNHFCEYAGFDFDIRNLFPDEATRMSFYRSYASEALSVEPADISEHFLKGLDMVTMHCVLTSNLFWGSWAAVQASCSAIDFDFMGYCDLRFDGFAYFKGVLGLVDLGEEDSK